MIHNHTLIPKEEAAVEATATPAAKPTAMAAFFEGVLEASEEMMVDPFA